VEYKNSKYYCDCQDGSKTMIYEHNQNRWGINSFIKECVTSCQKYHINGRSQCIDNCPKNYILFGIIC